MIKSMQQRAIEQQKALLLLSKKQWLAGHENILESLHLATETAAATLNIQRCSVWLYENDKSILRCMDLYDKKLNRHESGMELTASDYPNYFSALYKERIIAADDAHTYKYTSEFSENYLTPFGINSMLDAPIWLGGDTIGVLCCEHTGPKRTWEIDEQNFAASVADFASIAFELAEHKKTTDELRQHKIRLQAMVKERTNELNDKNMELEAFCYSVSHDLRAPLRHIDGYLAMIEEDYADKIDTPGQEIIKRIRNSAEKMRTMIDALLYLSQLSAQTLNISSINLSQLLQDIVSQLDYDNRAVTINIHETSNINGDIKLLRIALTNLLENALKYTSKSPNPYIEFGSSQEGNRTIFFLRDNGCGFDMQYNDKLFVAFQRLHRQEEYEGTGIGLSTVYRVIQRHGGHIWAEAEVGKGATFYFYLSDQ